MLFLSMASLFLLTCSLWFGEFPGLIVHRAKLEHGMIMGGIVSNGAWVDKCITIYIPVPTRRCSTCIDLVLFPFDALLYWLRTIPLTCSAGEFIL